MKHTAKCICQIDPNYKNTPLHHGVCIWCGDTGIVEYDLEVDEYKGEFGRTKFWSKNPEETVDAKIEYDEYVAGIICSCGDEIYLGEAGTKKVCSCGRVYFLRVEILKDDTHKGDMEYWEEYKKEKYK